MILMFLDLLIQLMCLSDDNQLCGPIFFFLAFILPMSESKRTGRTALYPILGGLVTFLVLATIRLCGVEDLPWWVVLLPLYLVLLAISVVIAWIAGYDTILEDEQRFDRLVPIFGNLLLTLFLIFLSLCLDGIIEWSWHLIFIPLFVYKGIMILLPIVLSVLTVYLDHKGSYWLEDRSRWPGNWSFLIKQLFNEIFWSNSYQIHPFLPAHMGSYCIAATLIAILVIGPLLAFELLLAKKLDNPEDDTPYSLIFIPLFILEGFGLCGCCIVNCAFLCS